jgi:alpha-ketoglutarate-dependent taurine dioxygenase
VHGVASSTDNGITITRRHPLIGAEIRGTDLRRIDDHTFRRICDAWLEHLLLVFPEQDVTDEEQIAFGRRFGALEIHPSREHRSSRHPEIYRVSNVDERGNIMPQESKSWRYMSLTWLWHTDSSFREVPSTGSILHGIEVPPEGGDTLFANMYAAYEALSDEMKERIWGLRVAHSHDQVLSHDQELKKSSEDYTRLPLVHHPLVRRHPVTGRLSLFLSPHTMAVVEGLMEDEGRACSTNGPPSPHRIASSIATNGKRTTSSSGITAPRCMRSFPMLQPPSVASCTGSQSWEMARFSRAEALRRSHQDDRRLLELCTQARARVPLLVLSNLQPAKDPVASAWRRAARA